VEIESGIREKALDQNNISLSPPVSLSPYILYYTVGTGISIQLWNYISERKLWE
jgi:hypothetical protein